MAQQDVKLRFSLVDGVSANLGKITGGLTEAGAAITFITEGATRLTGILGNVSGFAFLQESITQAGAFEDSIARIAGQAGATKDQFEALGDAVEQAALGTRFGVDEAAAALDELSRAGLGADAAIAALGPSLNFAQAAGLGAADATGKLDNALGAFGESAERAGNAADLLAAANLRTGANLGQLLDALGRVGPSAQAANVGIEDAVAALGVLATNSIEGGRAAAGLRSIFESFADPASAFKKALVEIGITTNNFGEAITQLASRGAAGEKALAALGTGGTVALRALLAEGGGALAGLRQQLQNVEGAAAQAAEPLNNTLNAALERLQEQFSAVRRALVDPLLEPLGKEVDGVVAALEAFAKTEAFEQIRQALAELFTAGATAVREFLADFDFSEASTAVANFASQAREAFASVTSAGKIMADTLRAAFAVIQSAIGGIEVVVNTLALAGARISESFAGQFSLISDKAAETEKAAGDLAIALEDRLGRSIDSTNAAVGRAIDSTGQLIDTVQQSSDAATDGAKAQRELAAAQAETAAAAAEGAKGQAAFAGAIAKATIETRAAAIGLNEALAQLNAELTKPASEQDGARIKSLRDAIKQLESGVVAADTAYKEFLKKNAEEAQKAREAIGGLAEETGKVAEAATAAGDAGADAGERIAAGAGDASAATGGIIGVLNQLFQQYAAVSAGADELFRGLFARAQRLASDIGGVARAIENADAGAQRAIRAQRDAAEGLALAFDAAAAAADDADQFVQRYAAQGSAALEQLAQRVRAGADGFDLLDRQQLDRLGGAIDRATERVRRLEEAGRAAAEELSRINNSLQDDLDRQAGNEEAILRREFEARVAQIRELQRVSGAAGQEQAREALLRAERLFQQELALIQQRKAQAIAAEREIQTERERTAQIGDRPAPAPPPQVTVQPQIQPTAVRGGGDTINIDISGVIAESPRDLARLLADEIINEIERRRRLTR